MWTWMSTHNPLDAHHHSHRHVRIVGIALMLTGSWISVGLEQHIVPHLIQDGVAYFLHGLGAAPFIGVLLGE